MSDVYQRGIDFNVSCCKSVSGPGAGESSDEEKV